jgi:hypothetical protein
MGKLSPSVGRSAFPKPAPRRLLASFQRGRGHADASSSSASSAADSTSGDGSASVCVAWKQAVHLRSRSSWAGDRDAVMNRDHEKQVVFHTWGRDSWRVHNVHQCVDGWLDCENLREEGWSDPSTWRCGGLNGRIIMNTVLCAGFRNALYRAKRQLSELLVRPSRSVSYGFRCKAGRHRSVAMERITQHCLTLDGYNVGTIHHDSCAEGRPLCGCPGRCNIATQEQAATWKEDGEAALLIAYRIWKSFDIDLVAIATERPASSADDPWA